MGGGDGGAAAPGPASSDERHWGLRPAAISSGGLDEYYCHFISCVRRAVLLLLRALEARWVSLG